MRKELAALLTSSWDFARRHRFIATVLGLITLAACAGALYLIAVNVHRYIPCLTGGCVG